MSEAEIDLLTRNPWVTRRKLTVDEFYRKKRAMAEDVLLLIEVAFSSVAYDRNVKLPLYASHGIPKYWLVRLDAGVVEV